MRISLIFLGLVLFVFSASAGETEGKVWSALIVATNQPDPPSPAAGLAPWAERLTQIFGYNRFDLVGESENRVGDKQATWLVPSKELFLRVIAEPKQAESYALEIQLFQQTKLLVETKARLTAAEPLFIRGPAWGQGQLILILAIR